MKINKYILLLFLQPWWWFLVISISFLKEHRDTRPEKMRWLSCCQTVFHLN